MKCPFALQTTLGNEPHTTKDKLRDKALLYDDHYLYSYRSVNLCVIGLELECLKTIPVI